MKELHDVTLFRQLTATAAALALSLGVAGAALAAAGASGSGAAASGGTAATGSAGAQSAPAACADPAALDSNDDGFVTDKEADAHAAAVIEAMDANGDGQVSKIDYMECQRRVTGLYAAGQEGQRACADPAAIDANNDGFVTDRETRAHNARIFDAVDRDDNGTVSKWDYMECQRQVVGLYDVSKTRAASCPQPSTIDANGDGFVTDAEADAHAVRVFSALDANGDNRVSRFEYVECQQGVTGLYDESAAQGTVSRAITDSGAASSGQKSDDRFGAMDSDSGGSLSAEEFMDDARKRHEADSGQNSADQAARQAAEAFAALDADGDGLIQRKEWTGSEQARQRAEKRFLRLDANNDAALSREEFTSAGTAPIEQAGEPVSIWIYRGYVLQ